MGITYNREQLKKLIQMQMDENNGNIDEDNLNESDVILLENTFDFAKKNAGQVMTPIEDVFMINV